MRPWLACGILCLLPVAAAAEAPPCETIRIISPYTAGGATDVLTRLVMEQLGPALKRTLVLENRAGGGSNIGSSLVAKSKPDGCVLLVNGTMLATFPSSYDDLTYHPMKELEPIGAIGATPTVLVTGNKTATLPDLIAQSRTAANGVSFAVGGIGLLQHLVVEALGKKLEAKFVAVPYPGSPTAIADMTMQRVEFGSFTYGAMTGLIEGGELKALAMAQPARSSLAPAIPSLTDLGLPPLDARVQFVLFGPAGMPPSVRATLEETLFRIVSEPSMRTAFAKISFEPTPAKGAEVSGWMQKTAQDWEPIIREIRSRPKP